MSSMEFGFPEKLNQVIENLKDEYINMQQKNQQIKMDKEQIEVKLFQQISSFKAITNKINDLDARYVAQKKSYEARIEEETKKLNAIKAEKKAQQNAAANPESSSAGNNQAQNEDAEIAGKLKRKRNDMENMSMDNFENSAESGNKTSSSEEPPAKRVKTEGDYSSNFIGSSIAEENKKENPQNVKSEIEAMEREAEEEEEELRKKKELQMRTNQDPNNPNYPRDYENSNDPMGISEPQVMGGMNGPMNQMNQINQLNQINQMNAAMMSMNQLNPINSMNMNDQQQTQNQMKRHNPQQNPKRDPSQITQNPNAHAHSGHSRAHPHGGQKEEEYDLEDEMDDDDEEEEDDDGTYMEDDKDLEDDELDDAEHHQHGAPRQNPRGMGGMDPQQNSQQRGPISGPRGK